MIVKEVVLPGVAEPAAYCGAFPSLADYVGHDARKPSDVRIGILTQDIFGPVRNAGIGTAYLHASTFLAEQGFDVTILYTQGNTSQTKPIEYWISFYEERGIKFVCVPQLEGLLAPSTALKWSYNGFRYLTKTRPFDLIHSSECGASPYYSLLAKRNNGLFADTRFCIKTSSPHLWSMEGNENLIGLDTGVIISAAERYCVEKADLVIAPSQHMLNWMQYNSYVLPQHVCVHPNVVPLSAMTAIQLNAGDVADLVTITEVVFFGRLEPRKGIKLFADAILKLLPALQAGKIKVSFLGKVRADEGDFHFEAFLTEFRNQTGLEIEAHTDKDAAQAVAFLKQPGRLAVIPSLLDNSPFTVYEALVHGFPFIASNVGGIPELVHASDREAILFDPRPSSLAKLLATIVVRGVILARLSFDPEQSLNVWRAFHAAPKIPMERLPATSNRVPSVACIEVDLQKALNIDLDLAKGVVDKSTAEFVFVLGSNIKLSASRQTEIAAAMARNDFEVGILTVEYETKSPVTIVNLEPSLWTKLDFSRLPTGALVMRHDVLRDAIQVLLNDPVVVATNPDELIAAVIKCSFKIVLLPGQIVTNRGDYMWNFGRWLRNRQVKILSAKLPADMANVFRIYAGLQDERARIVAAQPVLASIKRLLRIRDRLKRREAN